ncbi:DUF2804 family protein [Streptomyces sp. NPDC047985]|uniref:DUF2804 family protein n=1 Tax=Streptomyces sp. NPDC047985 TaxID=3155384 RepID=UPI00342D0D85
MYPAGDTQAPPRDGGTSLADPRRLHTSPGDGPAVGLTFVPLHNRSTRTDAGLIACRADPCFGHCSGRVRDHEGREIVVDRLLGWAEDVHMRLNSPSRTPTHRFVPCE